MYCAEDRSKELSERREWSLNSISLWTKNVYVYRFLFYLCSNCYVFAIGESNCCSSFLTHHWKFQFYLLIHHFVIIFPVRSETVQIQKLRGAICRKYVYRSTECWCCIQNSICQHSTLNSLLPHMEGTVLLSKLYVWAMIQPLQIFPFYFGHITGEFLHFPLIFVQ